MVNVKFKQIPITPFPADVLKDIVSGKAYWPVKWVSAKDLKKLYPNKD